jgi:hypothetical protein
MSHSTAVVTTIGGVTGNEIELVMRRALEASALDSVEGALSSGQFDFAVVLADAVPEFDLPAGATLEVDAVGTTFHLGRALADVIDRHEIDRVVFVGAGSGPLLTSEDFDALLAGLPTAAPGCVTNNYFSSDLFALAPASLFAQLDPLPASDNGIPRLLREMLDVDVHELPRTTATQLNIDSPIDLVSLALSDRVGPRLRAVLQSWDPATDRVARAATFFTDREAEVFVAGRVGSLSWRHLERETASRVRMLAEERGMAAAGRDAAGSARSMLGQLLQVVGPERWFQELLPELCDAAFLDMRPALLHLGITAPRGERFAADVGRVDLIRDTRLRDLVCAAVDSKHPTVLGGHTLVSGDLMLLNDWAWEEHDRAATGGASRA